MLQEQDATKTPFPEQVGDYLQMPIRRNFTPLRLNDIYVAQAPYAFLLSKDPIAAMHGSPWKYDTHVPVIVSGRWIPQARVGREIATVDVAAMLSEAFGLTLPSGTARQMLPEIITHSVSK